MTVTEFIETGSGLNDRCVIYKFTNRCNGKVYIGQTTLSLRKRVISHLSHARKSTKSPKHHLLFALLKYGYDNFDIDILETCNKDQLNEREMFWIGYYKSTDPEKGYNCTFGGDGCSVAREIKLSTRDKISKVHKAIWQKPGYREHQKEARDKVGRLNSRKVVQLTYGYDVVKIWDYKSDIVKAYNNENIKFLGIPSRKDVNDTYYRIIMAGYVWMYLDEFNKLDLSNPVMVQLDKNYKIISYFYEYRTANLRLRELIGRCGQFQFTANQKFTKIKGTKKAGYIWMTYETYKQYLLKNEIQSK